MEEKIATLARNTEGTKVIKVSFPYNLDMIKSVREIPGRKYHKDLKCWSVPLFPRNVKELQKLGFTLDPRIEGLILKKDQVAVEIMSEGINGLKKELRKFQAEGVAWIDYCHGRALIADEMGLGKTIEALAWLQLHPDLRTAIIVVPSIVKINWMREAKIWMTKPNVEILSGQTPWKPSGDILIINYEVLPFWLKTLRKRIPKVVIGDEIHYIKNNKARRTLAFKRLVRKVPNVTGLTGTPIENRPIELFNILNILAPEIFSSWFVYGRRYCNGKNNGFGWDFNGASHTNELYEKLTGSVMIRRLKKDVLKELPEKIPSFIPLELDNQKEYNFAEKNFIGYIKEKKGQRAADKVGKAEHLASIEGLKQVAVRGRLKQSIKWIEDFLDSGEKLVVFATHYIVIDAIMEQFSNIAVKLDGRVTSDRARQKAIDDFQLNPDIKLFIGNIKAAGKSINLTAASNVLILELPWTPGALDQAIDRVHRIGQKRGVNVWYLLALNTIEERIIQLIEKKRNITKAILEGDNSIQNSIITELINEYLNLN